MSDRDGDTIDPLRASPSSSARGIALFVGLFSLVNAVAGRGGDTWWIDLSFLRAAVAVTLSVGGAVLLVAYAVRPRCGAARRVWTTAAVLALTAAAAVNAVWFYILWSRGAMRPSLPVPFSLVIAAALGFVAWSAHRASTDMVRHPALATLAVALACAVAFPLLQVAFFGGTDYRRHADVAIVLGAKAYRSGRLSPTLESRVRTACELYRSGEVDALIMSGATGSEGVDEAAAMRDRAIELGVPADRILTDSEGRNTDATVRNTADAVARADCALVVSQFYHLPRLKLAYAAAGLEVRTVPAREHTTIRGTPRFVMREIPGFWVYWARASARSILSRLGLPGGVGS